MQSAVSREDLTYLPGPDLKSQYTLSLSLSPPSPPLAAARTANAACVGNQWLVRVWCSSLLCGQVASAVWTLTLLANRIASYPRVHGFHRHRRRRAAGQFLIEKLNHSDGRHWKEWKKIGIRASDRRLVCGCAGGCLCSCAVGYRRLRRCRSGQLESERRARARCTERCIGRQTEPSIRWGGECAVLPLCAHTHAERERESRARDVVSGRAERCHDIAAVRADGELHPRGSL